MVDDTVKVEEGEMEEAVEDKASMMDGYYLVRLMVV